METPIRQLSIASRPVLNPKSLTLVIAFLSSKKTLIPPPPLPPPPKKKKKQQKILRSLNRIKPESPERPQADFRSRRLDPWWMLALASPLLAAGPEV